MSLEIFQPVSNNSNHSEYERLKNNQDWLKEYKNQYVVFAEGKIVLAQSANRNAIHSIEVFLNLFPCYEGLEILIILVEPSRINHDTPLGKMFFNRKKLSNQNP